MAIFPSDADILSPIDDHIFKTLLTHPHAKPVLIDVLSATMDRNVTDATVRNNELPVSDDNEKGERFDVNCIIDGHDQADVEMHGSHIEEPDDGHTNFLNKCTYYLTDLHSSQPSKGKKYYELARTYQITFCNYTIYPNRADYITRASMRTADGMQITDQINFILIELSKLNEIVKKPVSQLTPLEMWSIFFKFAPDVKRRDAVNRVIAEKEELRMASTLLMEISQDEHQRAKYRSRRMYETDMTSNLLTAEERGEKRGLVLGEKRGLILGEERGKLSQSRAIAQLMKANNEPCEKIMQYTGLSLADVENA